MIKFASTRQIAGVIIAAAFLLASPNGLMAQSSNPLLAVDTSSPRGTMRTLFDLADVLENKYLDHQANPSAASQAEVQRIRLKLLRLFNLSQVPPASRKSVGDSAMVLLIDVLRRVDVPQLEEIPNEKAFAEAGPPASWSVPGTEITIARLTEGTRKGEFLFDPETVRRVGEFYSLVETLPLRHAAKVASWRIVQLQAHGWMIPPQLVPNLPEALKQPVLDTPAWKLIASGFLILFAAMLTALWHRLTWPRRRSRLSPGGYLQRLLTPLALVAAIAGAKSLLFGQIIIIGGFAELVEFTTVIALYLSSAWALSLFASLIVEWIITSPTIPNESLDANLLRLLGRTIGIVGIITVLGYGAQQLGIPIFGVVAGLGVGGLAVALAAQTSVENLIGGLNIFADRPIRIGDFCEYGDIKGHVEHIGLRSTKIRGLDRTVTSVPNSQLAKANITNYTLRDQMLFRNVLDLRYETTTDQLRTLVKGIRDYLSDHPKVRHDVAMPRVHVVGFGDWSIKIEVNVYIDTRTYPEFLAIQEGLMLRFVELVSEAGSSFAFPSQTTYVSRDPIAPSERQGSSNTEAERESAQLLPFAEWRK